MPTAPPTVDDRASKLGVLGTYMTSKHISYDEGFELASQVSASRSFEEMHRVFTELPAQPYAVRNRDRIQEALDKATWLIGYIRTNARTLFLCLILLSAVIYPVGVIAYLDNPDDYVGRGLMDVATGMLVIGCLGYLLPMLIAKSHKRTDRKENAIMADTQTRPRPLKRLVRALSFMLAVVGVLVFALGMLATLDILIIPGLCLLVASVALSVLADSRYIRG
jgi:hypothetical protein